MRRTCRRETTTDENSDFVALLSPVMLACLVVLPVLLWRLWDQPEEVYWRSSRRAPIWIGAATFVASSVALLVVLNGDPDAILLALIVGVVSVVLGYVYLGLAAILLGVLQAISLVEPIDGPAGSVKG